MSLSSVHSIIVVLESNSFTMATLTADIAEIAHILKRERYHRDTAQWNLCRAAFHPDASKTYINVAWFVQSPCPYYFLCF